MGSAGVPLPFSASRRKHSECCARRITQHTRNECGPRIRSIPPSPQPSPQGEGATVPALVNNPPGPTSSNAGEIHPLPKGEGRGEGKGGAASQAIAFCQRTRRVHTHWPRFLRIHFDNRQTAGIIQKSRAGFGHVLRGREHVLTIERGVSLVWFDRDGSPEVAYAAGLYAPQARLRIPSSVPQQVAMVRGAILD